MKNRSRLTTSSTVIFLFIVHLKLDQQLRHLRAHRRLAHVAYQSSRASSPRLESEPWRSRLDVPLDLNTPVTGMTKRSRLKSSPTVILFQNSIQRLLDSHVENRAPHGHWQLQELLGHEDVVEVNSLLYAVTDATARIPSLCSLKLRSFQFNSILIGHFDPENTLVYI